MKSGLACEEQRCPFLPTASMNKSHHAALWNSHVRLEAKSLTITRDDPKRDCVPGFLDQVDDVRVRLVGDGAAVDGQYSVPDLQLPAAVRRAAFDDASYFVGHGHTSISSFCVNMHVCFHVYFVCQKWVVMMIWLAWLFEWLFDCCIDFIFNQKGKDGKKTWRKRGEGRLIIQITISQFTHRKPIGCMHILCYYVAVRTHAKFYPPQKRGKTAV